MRTAFVPATVLTVAVGLLAGCGKKGPPQPPEPRGPFPAELVAVHQIGREVEIYFQVPGPRGDRPPQQLATAELVRVTYTPGFTVPPDPDAFRRRGEIVSVLRADQLGAPGERARVFDPELSQLAGDGVGWTLRYAIRLRDQRGRMSPLEAAGDLIPLETAPPPRGIGAEPTVDGVRLTWQPPEGMEPPADVPDEAPGGEEASGAERAEPAAGKSPAGPEESAESPEEPAGEDSAGDDPAAAPPGSEETPASADAGEPARPRYNLYRTVPGEPFPEQPINGTPTNENEYLDSDVVIGETYVYVVRVVLADGLPRREGESSEPFRLVAIDRFAPAAPAGLVIVQEARAVRLFWNPNRERDLGSYRVYRRIGSDGTFERIAEQVLQPSYIDRDVQTGQALAYYVTATDRAPQPNESGPSEIKELEVVEEPAGGAR